ncbi:hypothetical protein BDI4_540005 [Burkholderia diffusa]|nr:hypothetical protein BDI4_540005 [Burkholderia diffusa]
MPNYVAVEIIASITLAICERTIATII